MSTPLVNAGVSGIVSPYPVQAAVDRYVLALKTPQKLLGLHPRTRGGTGNAMALHPAVVLTSISAFEGFAEEFTALMMAHQGLPLSSIAKAVGKWNNPTLQDLKDALTGQFPLASSALGTGADVEIMVYKTTKATTPRKQLKTWSETLKMSQSWMEVRHNLTHGLATGWRAEHWGRPLTPNVPPAVDVLRDHGSGEHSIGLGGAISCARVYSVGAKVIADAVSAPYGQQLDWSNLPLFA